jgi:hypothetical protein
MTTGAERLPELAANRSDGGSIGCLQLVLVVLGRSRAGQNTLPTADGESSGRSLPLAKSEDLRRGRSFD